MLDAIRLDGWNTALLEFAREDVRAQIATRSAAAQEMALKTNEFWLARWNNEPVAVFGAVYGSLLKREAYVWVIPFQSFSIKHVRQSLELFEMWSEKYTRIVAHCYSPGAKRFAKFFGFTELDVDTFERLH